MLIDTFMPTWDVRSLHHVIVDATPERTYDALRTADLGRGRLVRGLLALRAIPAAVASGRLGDLRRRAGRRITLAELERHGFKILAESPPWDLLLGLEGAFWRPGGGLKTVDPKTFTQPVPPGVARAAWSFVIEPVGSTASRLATETRVLTGDRSARRWFRLYWACVARGSGMIRRRMLEAIRSEAEARAEDRGESAST